MKVRILKGFHASGIPAFVPGQVREIEAETAQVFIERGLVEAVQEAPKKTPETNKSTKE